ncbi:MAG: glycosyl hydrolase 115 family protein [Gemmatimonas sp.]
MTVRSIAQNALLFSALFAAVSAHAGDATVASNRVPAVADRFVLSTGAASTAIYVANNEYPGATRAARDLAADIGRVTNKASVVTVVAAGKVLVKQAVIIGTIGHSALIDDLVQRHKIDVREVAGKWESYVSQTVDNPMPGVDRALVIAGSDKRGTIYGTYNVSAQIGVSPWYYWADVPTVKQTSVSVPAERKVQGEPAVKYRGIFINDEAPAFSGWTREKFGGVNHLMYTKMFELILRMRGNYLWPAMWGNAFADDDSLNVILADEYGIVMGTSHHEPLTRAQQEWKRYGKGEWDYEKNDSTLRDFWRAGIQRMGTRENIVTVGMRGDGDAPMTQGTAISLLERIVADQRKMIADVTKKPANQTPQLWALYKEVQDYYDKGMRVPDDITLLFADDNWGNIRRLNDLKERNRAGGFGVYYHFDYVGGPRNYKWLNTNPIARVWEQLHLAHEYGANRIWIVNVGDLKPMEFPIQFFMDYAWNPDALPAEKLPEYTVSWARQQFGNQHAADIADIVTTYLKYNGRRKPELLEPETYSLNNFREAERVAEDYNALLQRATTLAAQLAPQYKDAFYQLVLHPVQASANVNDLYVTVGRNRQYAAQGRASTNDLADKARKLFDKDAAISKYYNTELAGGKWSHMMDQTHIGYTYWQEPPRNVMPRVDVIQLPTSADMGVAVVEVDRAPAAPIGRGGPPPVLVPGAGRGGPALPPFDVYSQQTYHVDVYNKGQAPFTYSASANTPWLKLSPATGTVTKETRVAVSVDWTQLPSGTQTVPITFAGPNNVKTAIQAVVNNPASPRRDEVDGFMQSNGYVSMEAEHYARAVGGTVAKDSVRWQRIPDLGRTLSGMTATPVTMPSVVPNATSPHLEYKVFLRDSGTVKVHTYLSPAHNFLGTATGPRYAISFDDDAPVTVQVIPDTSNGAWEKSVADNIRILMTRHEIKKPGAHTVKFWLVDPGIVLQKIVVETTNLPQSYLGPPESFYRTSAKGATR